MPSPLEYILLLVMSGADASADAAQSMNKISPAAGDATIRESIRVDDNGQMAMKTILMEPEASSIRRRLEAPVRITPDLVPLFKINHPVTLTMDETGQSHKAKIVRIESITDASGQTIQAILELNSPPDALQPGMTGTARMTAIP